MKFDIFSRKKFMCTICDDKFKTQLELTERNYQERLIYDLCMPGTHKNFDTCGCDPDGRQQPKPSFYGQYGILSMTEGHMSTEYTSDVTLVGRAGKYIANVSEVCDDRN